MTISSGMPYYDNSYRRYVFVLNASVEIYDFVHHLPGIQDTYLSPVSGLLCVVFQPLHAYDQECAHRAYNAVLASIDAHLNPPPFDGVDLAYEPPLTELDTMKIDPLILLANAKL